VLSLCSSTVFGMHPAGLSGRGGDFDPVLIGIQDLEDFARGQPGKHVAMQAGAFPQVQGLC
jgi:hypothetical protein